MGPTSKGRGEEGREGREGREGSGKGGKGEEGCEEREREGRKRERSGGEGSLLVLLILATALTRYDITLKLTTTYYHTDASASKKHLTLNQQYFLINYFIKTSSVYNPAFDC